MPSERKSRLEIGFDAVKTTQDAIGPAARRPISCGFAGGLIGKACNPLKPWVTSDNSQYVNQSPNRYICRPPASLELAAPLHLAAR